MADQAVTSDSGTAPPRAKAVLGTLILVAAVANLPPETADYKGIPAFGDALDAWIVGRLARRG